VIYDQAIIEAHAAKPADNWQTCECRSCEKRRDLRVLADALISRDEYGWDDGDDE